MCTFIIEQPLRPLNHPSLLQIETWLLRVVVIPKWCCCGSVGWNTSSRDNFSLSLLEDRYGRLWLDMVQHMNYAFGVYMWFLMVQIS